MQGEIKESCSRRIKQALLARGMKQSELCEKTKIPKSALSEYISGVYEPKQDRLLLIAQALNVDPVWLMGFDVPMEKVEEIYPGELQLSEVEKEVLRIFRLIPEEQQRVFLEMGRVFANNLKRD